MIGEPDRIPPRIVAARIPSADCRACPSGRKHGSEPLGPAVLDIERDRVGQEALEQLRGLVRRVQRIEPILLGHAEILAKADLANLGMPRSRAGALSAVATAAITDKRLFDTNSGLDDSIRRLRSIRGVGEWTAQYIALRQLREPDAFPAADAALMRAISRHEGREHSSSELLERAKNWQPWRAYAAQHLWASA